MFGNSYCTYPEKWELATHMTKISLFMHLLRATWDQVTVYLIRNKVPALAPREPWTTRLHDCSLKSPNILINIANEVHKLLNNFGGHGPFKLIFSERDLQT